MEARLPPYVPDQAVRLQGHSFFGGDAVEAYPLWFFPRRSAFLLVPLGVSSVPPSVGWPVCSRFSVWVSLTASSEEGLLLLNAADSFLLSIPPRWHFGGLGRSPDELLPVVLPCRPAVGGRPGSPGHEEVAQLIPPAQRVPGELPPIAGRIALSTMAAAVRGFPPLSGPLLTPGFPPSLVGSGLRVC